MRSSTYVKEREKLMKLRTNKKIKVTLNSRVGPRLTQGHNNNKT